MAPKGITISAVVAAAALAGLTISVFAKSQLRGPEGTVHRFMMAVGNRDWRAVDSLMYGSENEKVYVANFVDQVLTAGATYQVVDVNQISYRARVGVLFRLPNRNELPWVVSVRRVDRRWIVDANQSVRPGPAFMR